MRYPTSPRSTTTTSRAGVDVYLTNQSERVEAKRAGQRRHGRDRAHGGKATARRAPSSTACSTAHETSEVRFYGLGGNDTVVVTGGSKGPAGAADRRARATTPSTPPAPTTRSCRTRKARTARWTRGTTTITYTPPPPAEERALDPSARLDARELGRALGLLRRRPRRVPRLRHPHAELRLPQDARISTAHQVRAGWSFGQEERPAPTTPASSTARTAPRSSGSTPTPPASRCSASTGSATRPRPHRGPGLQQGQREPVRPLSHVQGLASAARAC